MIVFMAIACFMSLTFSFSALFIVYHNISREMMAEEDQRNRGEV